jgi:DNA-binding GntR family transcriptional regulator
MSVIREAVTRLAEQGLLVSIPQRGFRVRELLTDDHARDIPEEHRRLRDLAVAREADAGVALLTEHIERAPRELIAYAQKHDLDAGPAKAVPD